MKKTIGFLILFISLVFLGSCIIAMFDAPGYLSWSHRYDEFFRSFPLEEGGSLALRNRAGSIEISGWDRQECEVYAEKEIPDFADGRLWIFQQGKFMPEIEIDRFENFIRIETVPAPAEDAENVVDYYIRVPESVNLGGIVNRRGDVFISDLYGKVRAETREGKITIENFSGSLQASVDQGEILAHLYDLREEDEIILSVQSGFIELFLEPGVNANLEVFAPKGKIFSAFEMGEFSAEERISLQLGEGGAWISISVSEGDVQIGKIDQSESTVFLK